MNYKVIHRKSSMTLTGKFDSYWHSTHVTCDFDITHLHFQQYLQQVYIGLLSYLSGGYYQSVLIKDGMWANAGLELAMGVFNVVSILQQQQQPALIHLLMAVHRKTEVSILYGRFSTGFLELTDKKGIGEGLISLMF